ncbi:tRNA-dihydrouridine synthase [Desulfocapsa sulfexigens DSM 10523]|uniref:tRNA-dihydrouridine synthase n=1 Tax=Desulfocapsa sulfexigens (strain DSM 10523 / SB164P1) TaxID=1167006 RepID=M1NKB5_DESSD|nr:tRNA-dihydrouridine synthase family protein [Desulfocapsa sulfexigens]AGF80019.1 tRNA-dihydrouridine synthase [Desulfocapsa sulfexigens DSM 10523]
MKSKQPELVLAPIRGITDCHFRSLFQRHFPGFDSALAPFINPQRHSQFNTGQLKDILPVANLELPVTPQFLHTNPEDFLFLAGRLQELGYREVNWNLGCPAPMVTKKQRGSGLLPFPEKIFDFLDQVLPKLTQLGIRLSIKTRLGYENRQELLDLLPRLDQYPLAEIIIHGRLGSQMYKGEVDRDAFGHCLECTQHFIVYNGDITSKEVFDTLQQQFPKVDKWMIGRGALANPFLPAEIKGKEISGQRQQLQLFHDELYTCYADLLDGPAHLLGRMKQLWIYLSAFFPPEHKTWKLIKKCKTESSYQEIIKRLFD